MASKRIEKKNYTVTCGNVIATYNEKEYKESNVDIEVAIIDKGFGESNEGFIYKELDAILAATVICDGSYEKTLPEGEAVLAKWVEENGYEISDSERAVGIRHPYNEQDSDNYQTEIQLPVKKIK